MKRIIFRCDAGSKIGMGHVMRCLALAQAARDRECATLFVSHGLSDFLKSQIEGAGGVIHDVKDNAYDITDGQSLHDFAVSHQAEWIVVDSYQANTKYIESLKKSDVKVMVIHDYAFEDDLPVNILLNQNAHANGGLYPKIRREAKALYGVQHVLMREDYRRNVPPSSRPRERVEKILITMGGGEQAAQGIIKSIQILEKIQKRPFHVCILGPESILSEVQSYLQSHPPYHHYESYVSTSKLKSILEDIDFAMSASGTTSYELAYHGVPCAWIVLAENQLPIAEELSKKGYGLNLGFYHSFDIEEKSERIDQLLSSQERMTTMHEDGKQIIDGLGAERVLDEMGIGVVSVRHANDGDCEMIYKWSSDPSVRSVSFNSQPIKWEDHKNWYQDKMKNNNCYFYIGYLQQDSPLGQIRYEVSDNRAIVSTSLGAEYRGKGYGARLIQSATKAFLKETAVDQIKAFIKKDNQPSLKAFMRAGYVISDSPRSDNEEKWCLTYHREESHA